MPRNRSEKEFPLIKLTPRPRVNLYISAWYACHHSPLALLSSSRQTPEQISKLRRWRKQRSEAITSWDGADNTAWETLWPEGKTFITGGQLLELCDAAQSK